MLRQRAGRSVHSRGELFVAGIATAIYVAGFGAALLARPDRLNAMSVVIAVAAIGAGLLVVGQRGGLGISAAFIVTLLAAAFLGARSAAAAAVVTELAASTRFRTRWRLVVTVNLPVALASSVLAAILVAALASAPADRASFYLAVTLAAVSAFVLSSLLFALLSSILEGPARFFGLSNVLEFLPSTGISILVVLAGVSITLKIGNGGIAFALAAVFAFSYMAHLLERSRQRATQYVSLSWGVLAGLMRALDIRDERAARHAAAVAHFSQDIAKAVGMSDVDCELAHTAGLLHDIGRFALSDRVAERGRTLTEEDWTAIQRHPELGADMLRDLGTYGPVAEIVLAHHERIDGRGYPRGVEGDDIPEIARIVAVAEVYDTLTANDTYRTQMSSFEALNELRRVSGSQLDGRYVEVLAKLLAGVGVDYRHADTADFDSELDMERRIREAGAGA